MNDVKAWSRNGEGAQWLAAFKWGGYWYTIRNKRGSPRAFRTAEAARRAALQERPAHRREAVR